MIFITRPHNIVNFKSKNLISEWKFGYFIKNIVEREQGNAPLENYDSNLTFISIVRQYIWQHWRKVNILGWKVFNIQCAQMVLPSGIVVVGRREGVCHSDGSGCWGRGCFTFNCCFVLPTIFFHHCNLEAKTVHSNQLLLSFNWIWHK